MIAPITLTTDERRLILDKQSEIMTGIMQNGVAVVFQKCGSPIPIMPGAFNHLPTIDFTRSAWRSHCQKGAGYVNSVLTKVPMMVVVTYYVHDEHKDDDREIIHMFLELLHESMHVHESNDVSWEDNEDIAYEKEIEYLARWFPESLQIKLLQYLVDGHILRKDPKKTTEERSVKESVYNPPIRRMINRLSELKDGVAIYEEVK
ncbi:MAG: hypothetical protein ACYSUB_23130 [Planctomycetota bacterium]